MDIIVLVSCSSYRDGNGLCIYEPILLIYLQTSMSAWLTMETVNTPVPTLGEALAAPVTLAMNWIVTD